MLGYFTIKDITVISNNNKYMPYNKIENIYINFINFILYEIKVYLIKIYLFIECMLSSRISCLIRKYKFSKIN